MLASPLRKEGANLPLTDSYKAVSPIWDHAHVMQYVPIHRHFALSQGDVADRKWERRWTSLSFSSDSLPFGMACVSNFFYRS